MTDISTLTSWLASTILLDQQVHLTVMINRALVILDMRQLSDGKVMVLNSFRDPVIQMLQILDHPHTWSITYDHTTHLLFIIIIINKHQSA
jgi:hypothetical protein